MSDLDATPTPHTVRIRFAPVNLGEVEQIARRIWRAAMAGALTADECAILCRIVGAA